MPSRDSLLEAAKHNALEILNGENGGYVTLETNSDNQITELRIANNLDYNEATKCWRWNLGGLAYLSRATKNDPWNVVTAATMDGSIVADMIKSGTINAIDINGSTITGSQMQWVDGSDNNLGYVGWKNIISGVDTLEFYSSSHISMKCASNNMGSLFVKGGIDATRNIATNLKFYQQGYEVPITYTSGVGFSVFESGGSTYLGVYKNGSVEGSVRIS